MLLHDDNHDYRYERKFHVQSLSRPAVESMVNSHPEWFSEIYRPRWVNNAYLDTWTRDCYQANLEGRDTDRVKVRIRWYADFATRVQQPVLELKIKHGLVNCKRSYRLPAWDVNSQGTSAAVHQVFREADIPDRLRQSLLNLEITLWNRYWRSYYLSACGRFRITIDSELGYHPKPDQRAIQSPAHIDGQSVVVELKYIPEFDDEARQIAQHFPFRMTRSSKYVMGTDWLASRFTPTAALPSVRSCPPDDPSGRC
jgi:hypothetical protein